MSSTSQHDLDEAPEERPAEPEGRPPWLRRLAPAILVLGALVAGSLLFKRLPEEREVELRLDDAATVVQLDVTWTDSSSGDRADETAAVIDRSADRIRRAAFAPASLGSFSEWAVAPSRGSPMQCTSTSTSLRSSRTRKSTCTPAPP